MRTAILICLLLCLASTEGAHGCAIRGQQTIEVHVVWKFANPDLNKLWIADALNAKIEAMGFTSSETKQAQRGDIFDLSTCIWSNAGTARLSDLTFSLGEEKVFLWPRPIQWTTGPEAAIRYGRMTDIVVPPRPSPQKIILGDVTSMWTDKGEPRLKIILFNSTGLVHPGISLKMGGQQVMACFGPDSQYPDRLIIPIKVHFGRGDVDIFGGDPLFPGEMFRRKIDFQEASCSNGGGWFTLELGESGPLNPGLNVIRYAFTIDGAQNDSAQNQRATPQMRHSDTHAADRKPVYLLEKALKSYLAQTITVEGLDVYPHSTYIIQTGR